MKVSLVLAVCVSLSAALFASWARAADGILLEEIVVQGQTEPTWEESLSIREVRESPAKDVGEALQRLEGMDMVRKGAIANDVVLRGLQRDNINVLLDGVRINGACPNRMDSPAFHYDFAEVDRIRVVKGPYDLTNPGGLGGLVDAKTKDTPKGPGAEINGTYGSYDARAVSADVSYGADRWDGLLGYAYKDSGVPTSGDGNKITDIYPDSGDPREVGKGYREDKEDSDAYRINTAWTKWGLRPTASSRTTAYYSYQDAEHVLYPYLLMDADYDRTHMVNWTYELGDLSRLMTDVDLQAYWNTVDHLMDNRYRKASVGFPDGYTMETKADTTTWGAKLKGRFAAGKAGSLRVGTDYYLRNWDADNTLVMQPNPGVFREMFNPMIPDVDLDNWGVFAEYTRPLGERFTLSAGLRGDFTWASADGLPADRLAALNRYHPGSDDETDFQEWSGNLQLTYRPASSLEFFVGAGRGVRPPDPQELYINLVRGGTMPNWFGNPTLDPAKNYQADLGAKVFTERLYASASVFYSYVVDFIDVTDVGDPDGPTAPLKPARTYENVDASFVGFELGSELALPLDLFARASLSYVRGENEDDNRPLSEIPPLKGSVALRYDDDRFFVEAAENFADNQDRVDSSLNEDETESWYTTDVKAGYRHSRFSVYAGVNNVFDKFYYTHLSYQRDPFASGYKVPENGSNYYVTATVEL